MPHLTENQRHQALGMLQAQLSIFEVARRFNVNRIVIRKLSIRYQATGLTSDRPRSGRPRRTTAAEDNYIRLQHLRNRFQPAARTAREWQGVRRISRQTVARDCCKTACKTNY